MEKILNNAFENSIFAMMLKRLGGIWMVFMLYYKKSIYGKSFKRIMDFFSKAYCSSNLYKVFASGKNEDSWLEKSGIYRFFSVMVDWLDGILVKVGTGFVNASKGSIIIGRILFLKENLFKISLRYYGATVIVFGLFKAVIDIFIQHQSFRQQILEVAVIIVGSIMTFINSSLIDLYNGANLRKILGLKEISYTKLSDTDGDGAWAITEGVLLGVLTVLPMWKYIIVGAIGSMAVLTTPIIGAFVAIVLFPFLPTMALVGVMVLSHVGLVIARACGVRQRVKVNLYEICLLIVLGGFLFGVINSFAPMSSLKIAVVYIVLASSFSVLRRTVTTKKSLFIFIDMILLASAVVCGYGLYQKLSGTIENTAWLDASMFGDLGGRVYSTFANPNVFGEYLLLTIPLCIARLSYAKGFMQRLFYMALLGASAGCMVLTMSRGCWIGIMVAVVIYLMYQARGVIPFAFIGLFFVPIFLSDKIINRFLSIGNMSDSSTSYRVYIWEGTMRMLHDFWYTGVGIGMTAYNVAYPTYSYSAIVAPHPHSLYMLIFSETGILGFIAIALLSVMFFRKISVSALSGGKFKLLAVAMGGGMAGFLIQGCFDNVWYNYRVFMFFFMFLALADVLAKFALAEKEGKQELE